MKPRSDTHADTEDSSQTPHSSTPSSPSGPPRQRALLIYEGLYGATVNHDEMGLPLTAFISIRPIDPSQPDDSPSRLEEIPEIESCWSVAGDESYILKVRLARPSDLEELLARIRAAANVSTRTTIVLSTYYENRPVTGG